MASPLVRWLAGHDREQLAALLTRRPDVLAGPPVDALTDLAVRLQARDSVIAAVSALPRPAVQVIEVMQALGGPAVSRERVAGMIGRPADDPELDATLAVLAGRALVWPAGGELRMAGPLWTAFAYPLGLGAPAATMLDTVPAEDLRRIARALGLAVVPGNRQRTLAAVVTALADAPAIRALVSSAPPQARTLLTDLAHLGPVLPTHADPPGDPALDWAVRHGLLVRDGWRHVELPAEVAIALRGPDWRAPFDPLPPRPELAEVDPDAVAREAAAAALAAVERMTSLLDAVETAPVALLRAGGVGTRELRRLARSVGCPEPELRFWLELGYAAGLLGIAAERVRPTGAYDEWAATPPAERLPVLLRAWLRLPAAPLAERPPELGPTPAALLRDGTALVAADLRAELLRCASELPEGHAVGGPDGPAGTLRWRLPLLADPEPLPSGPGAARPAALPTALWREAGLVGAVAHGALTPLGRALLDDLPGGTGGAAGRLSAIAGELLPAAVRTALFQNDLTAVVPGIPAVPLSRLLDASAEREAGGGAAIWRFGPASVRGALDAGTGPAELLGALRAVATGGKLPQALEYLVADVGRQHGRVRVRAVGCVLRAEDPALVAEIVRTRALRPLALAVLAPTVLASAKPVAETLRALRDAGYAPATEDNTGEPLIERVRPQRAPTPRRAGTAAAGRRPAADPGPTHRAGDQRRDVPRPDPVELAARLLAAAAPEPEPEPDGHLAPVIALPLAAGTQVERAVRGHCGQLDPEEQRLLSTAIERGTPVKIDYRDSGGGFSSRLVEPIDLDGHLLTAWCHLRDDERMFVLDRIQAVGPG
ncbi:helicase C-terminal domain-containing protein [Plantactinospora sp. CA-290183]|uniref:helicase C-terminal domain-containing protein n=1 Tax=Plantactinospora sp. CA-290183 TaxID=3240006 RepID=UPI003D92ED10